MVLELDRMTFDEVEEYLRTGPGIAILPSGAIEQHGVHGAIGTDAFSANVVARKVAEKVNGILLPSLPYGVSHNHINYAGTITLQPTTLALVVKEILQNLSRQGFKLILVITGNRGNEEALKVAAVEARQPGGPFILTMAYQDANRGRLEEVLGDWAREITLADVKYGSDGHGGAIESSLAMVEAPEGFRPEKIKKPDRSIADARRGLSFSAMLFIEEIEPSGIFGDPHGMSRELGEHLAEKTAEKIAADIQRFMEVFPKPVQRGAAPGRI